MASRIDKIRHNMYTASILLWQKWRDTYEGGENFKKRYLKQWSTREDTDDFEQRVEISPIPRFAGAAVDEIINSITIRLRDVKRTGGSKAYQDACIGKNGGVDQRGTTMSAFIAQNVLPEMLTMRQVGVFVDRPSIEEGATQLDAQNKNCYIYHYCVEDIMSWSTWIVDGQVSYKALLLKEEYDVYDDETGLACGSDCRYRRLWINEKGTVSVQLYLKEKKQYAVPDENLWVGGEIKELKLKTIPFVDFSIKKSLLEDVADHQIALLNMESADVTYGYKGNFPLYTEQYDPQESQTHLKKIDPVTGVEIAAPEKKVGVRHGRRYPRGLDRPDYVHPSSEPLEVSMKKGDQLKADIRQLVGLAVSTLQPGRASAESKGADNQTTEAGMANIGLELELGEQRIAKIIAEYEASEIAIVQYPKTYALITDGQRVERVESLQKLQGAAPSKVYALEVAKDIATTLFEHRIPKETLDKMLKEIDVAPYITSDPESIKVDMELGLVSEVTASNARGYDGAKEVPVAREEHAERAARIVEAQTSAADKMTDGAARGVKDLDSGDGSADGEKKKSQRTPDKNAKVGEKKVRS